MSEKIGKIDPTKLNPIGPIFKRQVNAQQFKLFDMLLDHSATGVPVLAEVLESQLLRSSNRSYITQLVASLEKKLSVGRIIRIKEDDVDYSELEYPAPTTRARNGKRIAAYLWDARINPPAELPAAPLPKWNGMRSITEPKTKRFISEAQKVLPDNSKQDVISTPKRERYLRSRRPAIWQSVREDILLRMLSLLHQEEAITLNDLDILVKKINPIDLVANVIKSPSEYTVLGLELTPVATEDLVRKAYAEGLHALSEITNVGLLSPRLRKAHQLYQSLESRNHPATTSQ